MIILGFFDDVRKTAKKAIKKAKKRTEKIAGKISVPRMPSLPKEIPDFKKHVKEVLVTPTKEIIKPVIKKIEKTARENPITIKMQEFKQKAKKPIKTVLKTVEQVTTKASESIPQAKNVKNFVSNTGMSLIKSGSEFAQKRAQQINIAPLPVREAKSVLFSLSNIIKPSNIKFDLMKNSGSLLLNMKNTASLGLLQASHGIREGGANIFKTTQIKTGGIGKLFGDAGRGIGERISDIQTPKNPFDKLKIPEIDFPKLPEFKFPGLPDFGAIWKDNKWVIMGIIGIVIIGGIAYVLTQVKGVTSMFKVVA